MLAARTEAIRRYKDENDDAEDELDDAEINSRLVAYCSDQVIFAIVISQQYHTRVQHQFGSLQAHSSVEKAGLIGLVKLRYIESDETYSLRLDKLEEAIENDREKNLIPFFVRSSASNLICVSL